MCIHRDRERIDGEFSLTKGGCVFGAMINQDEWEWRSPSTFQVVYISQPPGNSAGALLGR